MVSERARKFNLCHIYGAIMGLICFELRVLLQEKVIIVLQLLT